ncbi:MAG: class I SAM-dependent methyltransferase [Rivularia sp. (in: cyanobacteria)]
MCILKTQVNLHTIQQTLLVFFLGRGKQFEQVKSIVTDGFTVEIVKILNYGLEKLSNTNNCLVASCLQGVIIDNMVSNLLRQYPQSTVVEVGAGLNIRFKHLDNVKVPRDLLDAIQLRQDFIVASVVQNDWIEAVKETSTTFYILFYIFMIFVAELWMYLSKQQVKQLFDKLIENFSDSSFVFDSVLSLMVKRQKRLIKYMSANFDYLYFRYLPDSTFKLRLLDDEIITYANFEVKFHLLSKYFPSLIMSNRLNHNY